MVMTRINGIDERIFWIAEFNDYELKVLYKIPAYTDQGEFTDEVSKLIDSTKIWIGSPINAICDIITNERINKFLTPEKQEELINLFTK